MSKCDCNDNRKIRIVYGNDLTVEAVVSVYDRDSGVYKPLDLSGATDVALRLVGTFSKVPGRDTTVTGSRVSAFFPAGRLGKGVYGVEITFRDTDGRGRAFERSLIEVVESSGEATVESTAEGETGDGLNITVDVRTRTVRIGGTGAADYPSLTGKPSINGVVLEGNKTPEELGIAPSHIIPSDTLEVLMDITSSLKQAEAIEIPEESFRKLEALPEVGFVSLYGENTVLLGAGPIVKGEADTFTVITGLSCLSLDPCPNFAYAAEDGKYMAIRFAGSVPKSISLEAKADGTMTSSLSLDQALGTTGGYSFPAFIVRSGNNYRYYSARDTQIVTSSYGGVPSRAYLSINGVYYKWEEDVLTPIRSTIGKTPVIYDLRLERPGGNLTIDNDELGNSIVDEIDFKARNPDKSTLIVRVSTYDKRSILFTSFRQGSDDVITSVSLSGYDPENGSADVAVLSITPDKVILLKQKLAYIPSGETYTKVEADGRFETKEQAVADLASVNKALDGCAKKTELPSKTSQLTNDSGFIDSTALAPYAKTGDVNAELKKKADKAEVEPYDCSWVFRLSNGAEVTYEQYSELDRVTRSGQPLYAKYKEQNSSVIGMYDTHSDNYSEMVFLLYTSYRGGIQCVISDRDMVNDGHYMEVNISYWGLQQLLVSGTNIKTVNGVPVLGSGDIKTPAPTKVSELENDKGFLTEHQSLEAYYQKAAAQLDNRVVAEVIVSLAARLDALEGSRGLLGDATAGTVDVSELTRCRYPLVMLGHGVPAEANVPENLPEGLPWDGVPAFAGQQYVNLDAASGGLYYAAGVDSVADWKQA